MKVFKLSALFLSGTVFLAGCNQIPQQEENVYNTPNQYGVEGEAGLNDPALNEENVRWARENFDLQAVGALLERADSPEEFESLLNDPDEGVNNLDMNGDGLTDYISVREFGEGDQRGFSLFNMFGPELIQEIATILFDRSGGDFPGARVLMRGNEQIYGDNYNYENNNWLDQAIPIIASLFGNRDQNDDGYYTSPYYYNNYPDYYEPYEVVETPVYRERIEPFYATPVFVQTAQPTVVENIRIISPNAGRTMDRIYTRMAKPTREQIEFVKNNPKPPKYEKFKDYSDKPDKEWKKEQKRLEKAEKFEDKQYEKARKFEDKQFEKAQKFEDKRRDKAEKYEQKRFKKQEKEYRREREYYQQPNPVRYDKPNKIKYERQEQPRFERPNMKPPKAEKQNGNPNKGGGDGGGKKGGGGGKGKGKG